MGEKAFFKDFDREYFHAQNLAKKVESTIKTIQTTLSPYTRISLSFSGGKDSQLCLMLCAEAGIDFDVAVMTSNYAYPETMPHIYRICKKYGKKLIEIPCSVDPLEAYIELGVYRDNSNKKAAFELIKRDFYAHNRKYEVNITGIRKMESKLRRFILSRSRGFEYSKKNETHFYSPIWDYKNNDVYSCITVLGEEYHPIYYKARDLQEREWRRVNWYINSNWIELGAMHEFKREYPELYYKLVARVPYLRSYV